MADKKFTPPGAPEIDSALHDEGDGTYSPAAASKLRYWNTSTLLWEKATGSAGSVSTTSSGAGAVTVADGADVAQGTTTDLSTANTVVGILKAIKAAVQATLTVGGTVTANQGTAAAASAAWPHKLVDSAGANVATVKAASTAIAATDLPLAVGLHPTSPLPTGTNTIGALTANQSVNVAQVNGAATVASVTGVQDVMPRKRTGTTGLSPSYSASHITTIVTTTPVAVTAYVSTIVIACSGAGTSWTLKIQNKEATPKILVPSFTLTVPTTGSPIILQFAEPIVMTSGIDIITAGTTAGTVDVFVTYWS